ncbi:MAG: hemagglutinin protein [Mucilaginibacter sp.]|nr:hemagglutinin protein [Mucilaginibacter sp.]
MSRKIPSRQIQIVPLFPGPPGGIQEGGELFDPTKALAAPPNARLAYQGGQMLSSVKVFTVFWGQTFANGALAGLPDQINGFFDTILQGALMAQMAEYDTGGYKVGNGTRTGSKVIPASPAQNVSDADIQAKLQDWLANDADFPQPDANTLYFIYLESGVSVTMQGEGSCTAFCGYHGNIGNNILYAVMPYPDCFGCRGGKSVFDALTGTSSHELCEAITDAIPGSGWYDQGNNMEIGDLCAWQFKTVDGYNVQLEWSNRSNACV